MAAVITSYSTLLAAVQSILVRSGLSAEVPGWVQSWEEDFYREPKNFGSWMEASLNSTIASSVIAVPTGYLGMKYAYVNGSPSSRLDRVSLNQIYGRYPRGGGTARPSWIARDGANFVFGPEPDSDYTIKGTYWVKPTVLRSAANDADAHWLILNAPDLCLYGALLQSAPALRNDSRIQTWSSLYSAQLASYRNLFREEDVSGSPVQEVLA